MSAIAIVKDLMIIASILFLLILGVGITLRSEIITSGRERCAPIGGNLSRMVIELASWTALFSIFEQLAGLRASFLP